MKYLNIMPDYGVSSMTNVSQIRDMIVKSNLDVPTVQLVSLLV